MAKRSKAERAASAASRTAGTGVGAAASGFFSNPAVIITALVLGGLFIFRDKISEGFGGLFENLKFPEIPNPFENLTNPFEGFEFPTFTNPFEGFEFPTFTNPFEGFELPDFTSQFEGFNTQFQDLFSGFQLQLNNLFGTELEMPTEMVENTGLLTQEQLDQCQCGSSIKQDAFGNVNHVCKTCASVDTQLPSQDPSLNIPDTGGFVGGLGDPNFLDFLGLTPAQQFQQDKIDSGEAQPIPSNLPTGFEFFQSGGSTGFTGASINQTPIANLSLSQIIDMFNVTASQAANILAIANNDFGDFDFGTNTGSGIGSVFQDLDLSSILPSGNVSDSQFQGLSATEIANLLTGGNIQNF